MIKQEKLTPEQIAEMEAQAALDINLEKTKVASASLFEVFKNFSIPFDKNAAAIWFNEAVLITGAVKAPTPLIDKLAELGYIGDRKAIAEAVMVYYKQYAELAAPVLAQLNLQ